MLKCEIINGSESIIKKDLPIIPRIGESIDLTTDTLDDMYEVTNVVYCLDAKPMIVRIHIKYALE